MLKKNWFTKLTIFIILVAIGYISVGINYTDSEKIAEWVIEREKVEKNYLTFLDYYSIIPDVTENVLYFNSILILLLIHIIFRIGKPNILLLMFMAPFAALISVVSKEIFFLLGVSLIFYAHVNFSGWKKIIILIFAAYILTITKLALGLIYIGAYIYSCSCKYHFFRKFIYIKLIFILYLAINLPIYTSYTNSYFLESSPSIISGYFYGNDPLDWLLRFLANMVSPIINIFDKFTEDNYQIYIGFFSISLILRLIYLFKYKNIFNYFGMQFFIITNISIAILIPFVQSRYIIPSALLLYFTKIYNDNSIFKN